jgi:hypothetical protein
MQIRHALTTLYCVYLSVCGERIDFDTAEFFFSSRLLALHKLLLQRKNSDATTAI